MNSLPDSLLNVTQAAPVMTPSGNDGFPAGDAPKREGAGLDFGAVLQGVRRSGEAEGEGADAAAVGAVQGTGRAEMQPGAELAAKTAGRQEFAALFARQWAALAASEQAGAPDGGPRGDGAGRVFAEEKGGSEVSASSPTDVSAVVASQDVLAALMAASDPAAGAAAGAARPDLLATAPQPSGALKTEAPVMPVVMAVDISPQLKVLTAPAPELQPDGGGSEALMAFAREQGFDSEALRLVFGRGVAPGAETPTNGTPLAAPFSAPAAAYAPGVAMLQAAVPQPGMPAWTATVGGMERVGSADGSAGAALQPLLAAARRAGTAAAGEPLRTGEYLSPAAVSGGASAAVSPTGPGAAASAATAGASAGAMSLAAALRSQGLGAENISISTAAASAGAAIGASAALGPGTGAATAAAWMALQRDAFRPGATGLGAGAAGGVTSPASPAADPLAWLGLSDPLSATPAPESAANPALSPVQGSSGATEASSAGTHAAPHPTGADPIDLREHLDKGHEALSRRMGEVLAQRLISQIERGDWQVRLSVAPEHLGPIDIELQVRGQRIEAQFQVANAQTQSLIQDGLSKLREAVGSSGMDLASVWVSGGWAERHRGNPTPGQPDDPASLTASGAGDDADEGTVEGIAAVERSRSDRTPGQGSVDILI